MYARVPGAPARRLLYRLGAGGALLLLATGLSVVSLAEASRDTEAISHGHEAIARLRSAHLALADVELAARDYLLLGDPAVLAPAGRAERAALDHVDRVLDLVADRADQVRRVQLLRRLLTERFERVRTLAARPAPGSLSPPDPGPDLAAAAQELVVVHDAVGAVLADEEHRIAALADATRTGAVARAFSFAAVAALILLLLLMGYLVTRRDARLREALQATKDRLALAVVHDLRNPLFAIMGNLDLTAMYLPSPSADVAHCLAQARRSARRMVDMVSTIVDVVRLEHGRMPLECAACDLARIAAESVAEYQAFASSCRIDLRLVAAGPVSVYADPGLVARIAENLISNAIKHTPPGGSVEVSVAAGDRTAGGSLRVKDTGEGIAPQDLPRLFTMYGRVEGQERTSRYDTGLGLVFCRLALEAQGGSIRAESTPGQGAAFLVDLPGPATRG